MNGGRAPASTRWIRALWVLWLAAVAVFAGGWWAALAGRGEALVGRRRAAFTGAVARLRDDFAGLAEREAAVAAPLVRRLALDALGPVEIARARRELEPYWTVRVWGPDGASAAGDDRDAPPLAGSLRALVTARLKSCAHAIVRPPAPGMAPAGPEALPASYWLDAARGPGGRTLVLEARLDTIFGAWLGERFRALDLGPDAGYARVLPGEAVLQHRPDAAHPEGAGEVLRAWKGAEDWVAAVPAFFGDELDPLDAVAVRMENGPAVAALVRGAAPVLAGGGAVLACFGLALAFTARGVRREMELAEARATFTAMVSHELRTPVAAIRMYAEILENRMVGDPAKVADYYRVIGAEAKRLERLVDDVLALGRVQRGARRFATAACDVEGVVRDAIALACAARRPGEAPAIAVEVAEGLPRAVCDRDALVHALANLVDNALKHGGDPAQVKVVARPAAAGAAAVAVEVLDRGPGIPRARWPDAFEPFVRLAPAGEASPPGTGLGLALVKELVNGQGARIALGERDGGGCAFTVTLDAEAT